MYSLIVDIGNTFIKIAKSEEKHIVLLGKINSDNKNISKEISDILRFENLKEIKNVCISSVKPSATHGIIEFAFHNDLPIIQVDDLWWVNQRINHPKNSQLGQDLLALCSYCSDLSKGDAIIITSGTTTAITIVKNKKIAGAIIFPGIVASLNNLTSETALINTKIEELASPGKKVLGADTLSAVEVGVIKGQAHQINGFIKDLKEKYKINNIYITGGNYKFIKNYLNFDSYYDELLVLRSIDFYCNLQPTLLESISEAFQEKYDGILNPIAKGRTNQSWWFERKGKKYVIRKSNINKTYSDMQYEAKIFWKLKFEDITVQPICISPKDQILITEYMEHDEFIANKENIDKVCNTLKNLHSLEWEGPEFDPIEKIKKYDQIRIKNNYPESNYAKDFLQKAQEIMYKYPKKYTPIHTDISDENILISKNNQKAYLIDWEYSGIGNSIYDAAVLCVRNDLDQALIQRVADNFNVNIDSLYEWMFIAALLGMYWTYTKENWTANWDSYHKLQVLRTIKYNSYIWK